jgi:hypothetical protein
MHLRYGIKDALNTVRLLSTLGMNEELLIQIINTRILSAIRRSDIPQFPQVDITTYTPVVDRLEYVGRLLKFLCGFYLLMEEVAGELCIARGALDVFLASQRPRSRAQRTKLREALVNAEFSLSRMWDLFDEMVCAHFEIKTGTYSTLYIIKSDWILLGLRS